MIHPSHRAYYEAAIGQISHQESRATKLLSPILGGAERADSVAAGLAALAPHAPDYVLIHELAHLKHHDHGPEFWKLIDVHAGDWRKAKHHLDGLVELLLSD